MTTLTRQMAPETDPATLQAHLDAFDLGAPIMSCRSRVRPVSPGWQNHPVTLADTATVEIDFDGDPDEQAVDAAIAELL